MLNDAILAILHHLTAFGLVAVVGMQWMLMRMPPANAIRPLALLDRWYGVLALAMVVIGTLRIFYGAKPAVFFLHNPAFHGKLTLFVIVGLVSILPTMRFIKWNRLRQDPTWVVPVGQWKVVRRCLAIEFHLLLLIPILAALASRGVGM